MQPADALVCVVPPRFASQLLSPLGSIMPLHTHNLQHLKRARKTPALHPGFRSFSCSHPQEWCIPTPLIQECEECWCAVSVECPQQCELTPFCVPPCVCMHACVCMCVCMYLCVYVCVWGFLPVSGIQVILGPQTALPGVLDWWLHKTQHEVTVFAHHFPFSCDMSLWSALEDHSG